MDAGSIGNKDRPGPADEQSALDHPDQPSDPLFEAGRIGDRAEIAVENSIAAVVDERLPGGRHAQICVGAERLEPCLCCLQTKGHGFDRYRACVPRRSTSLAPSMMMASRRLLDATIFSCSRAPPSPFIRLSVARSTSSAPSIARSIWRCGVKEVNGMPSAFARAAVRSEVGIPTKRNPC